MYFKWRLPAKPGHKRVRCSIVSNQISLFSLSFYIFFFCLLQFGVLLVFIPLLLLYLLHLLSCVSPSLSFCHFEMEESVKHGMGASRFPVLIWLGFQPIFRVYLQELCLKNSRDSTGSADCGSGKLLDRGSASKNETMPMITNECGPIFQLELKQQRL